MNSLSILPRWQLATHPPKFLAKPLPEWPQIGRHLVDNTKILKIARSFVSQDFFRILGLSTRLVDNVAFMAIYLVDKPRFLYWFQGLSTNSAQKLVDIYNHDGLGNGSKRRDHVITLHTVQSSQLRVDYIPVGKNMDEIGQSIYQYYHTIRITMQ